MTTYEKSFKEEAVKLSDEIGIKKAAAQLGIPYYTLADCTFLDKSNLMLILEHLKVVCYLTIFTFTSHLSEQKAYPFWALLEGIFLLDCIPA